MSEANTAIMAGRLSTKSCKCNSLNLDRILRNDRPLERTRRFVRACEGRNSIQRVWRLREHRWAHAQSRFLQRRLSVKFRQLGFTPRICPDT